MAALDNPLFVNGDKTNDSIKTDESSVKSVSSCVNLLIVESGEQVPDEVTHSPFRVIHKFKSRMTKSKTEQSNNLKKTKGTSSDETLMHMIKANIGPGLLAIPFAFKNAGVILGSIGLWLLAVICTHCIHILLRSYKFVTDKTPDNNQKFKTIGYDEVVFLIMKEKFGPDSKIPKLMRILISSFLIISQLGFCCVYFVFIPTNIEQVIQHYYPDTFLTIKMLMILLLIPMTLYCMIRNLKYLAPFSAFANILMIGSVVVILYDLFIDGDLKPFNQLYLVAPVVDWPTFFSSAVYAFEGIGCVLPVYHGMEDKEFFTPINGVLNTSMMLVAIMYYAVGFFGYLKYGNDAEASITLNLPVEMVVFQGVKLCFAIAVFITFNLQFLVGCDVLWNYVYQSSNYLQSLNKSDLLENENEDYSSRSQPKEGKSRVLYLIKNKLLMNIETVFRSAIIFLTFALAYIVPRIDLFISLIGALGSSTLALIVPPALDLLIFWPLDGYSKKTLIKDVLILLFGIYVFIAGTYTSMADILDYIFG